MGNTYKRWILGVVAGGILLATLAVGYQLGTRNSQPEISFTGEHPLKLKAVAGYGTETFAMCTGPVDDDAEGLFTLDYLTGELQCWVLNPRTGKWGALFKRNVATDLEVEKGKKPAFVVSTGIVNFPRGGTLKRPSNCVVYVADANTGKFAAYTVPWTPGAMAAVTPQWGEMFMLDKGAARTVEIRQ